MKLSLKINQLRARFYAFGIDLFAIALIQKALIISYLGFVNAYLFSLSDSAQFMLKSNIRSVELPLMLLSFWSYFFISIYATSGKTLGKMVMGLEVYSPSDEGAPCIWQSITRATVSTVSYLLILPMSFPLFNTERKSLADMISQTVVLHFSDSKEKYHSPVESSEDQKLSA
jgi:uncharacterized RDD family membrane protein YckC